MDDMDKIDIDHTLKGLASAMYAIQYGLAIAGNNIDDEASLEIGLLRAAEGAEQSRAVINDAIRKLNRVEPY